MITFLNLTILVIRINNGEEILEMWRIALYGCKKVDLGKHYRLSFEAYKICYRKLPGIKQYRQGKKWTGTGNGESLWRSVGRDELVATWDGGCN